MTVVAANETLRNSTLNMLEKFNLNAIPVATPAEVFTVQQHFDILIICPSASGEGRGLFDTDEGYGTSETNSSDSLRACWSTIKNVRERLPGVKHILMCPITQLSQSSEFRTVQDCVVLSRPVRASHVHRALHRLLQDVSAPQDGPDDFLVSSSMPPAVEEVTIHLSVCMRVPVCMYEQTRTRTNR